MKAGPAVLIQQQPLHVWFSLLLSSSELAVRI
jgi:hypothetical protein